MFNRWDSLFIYLLPCLTFCCPINHPIAFCLDTVRSIKGCLVFQYAHYQDKISSFWSLSGGYCAVCFHNWPVNPVAAIHQFICMHDFANNTLNRNTREAFVLASPICFCFPAGLTHMIGTGLNYFCSASQQTELPHPLQQRTTSPITYDPDLLFSPLLCTM